MYIEDVKVFLENNDFNLPSEDAELLIKDALVSGWAGEDQAPRIDKVYAIVTNEAADWSQLLDVTEIIRDHKAFYHLKADIEDKLQERFDEIKAEGPDCMSLAKEKLEEDLCNV